MSDGDKSRLARLNHALDQWAVAKPKQFAMATIGLALVLLALQYGVIVHFRLLSRLLVCASLILLSVGVWMFVTGSTYRRGANAPRWWRIGYFCFAALGLGVGFYVVTLIS